MRLVFTVPCGYVWGAMVFGWFKKRRRRRLTAEPFPESWRGTIAFHWAQWFWLTKAQRQQLEAIVQVLVAEKSWEGCGGLAMNDEIKVTIAAQAGLLLLGIAHDYYRNVKSILVYPDSYVLPQHERVRDGVVTTEDQVPVHGTAHLRGPVIVSWRRVQEGARNSHDGYNLVFHEFAHKLDMLDGVVDGTPPLPQRELYDEWVEVMSEEYDVLRLQIERGRRTFLRPYAETDVAEFFAVATEMFFEKPEKFIRAHRRLYEVLSSFYGQDPARRPR